MWVSSYSMLFQLFVYFTNYSQHVSQSIYSTDRRYTLFVICVTFSLYHCYRKDYIFSKFYLCLRQNERRRSSAKIYFRIKWRSCLENLLAVFLYYLKSLKINKFLAAPAVKLRSPLSVKVKVLVKTNRSRR